MLLPHDRDAVRRWVREWADEQTGAEMMASLPSLPTGTAWVWAPEMDILCKVSFSLPSTYDGGKRVAPGKKEPELKPIDLAAVRGKLEIVAKEAVENDPRRLKARIAELERKLAADEKAKSNAVPQAEVNAAEQRGYERGIVDGRMEMVAHYTETLLPLTGLITESVKAGEQLLAGWDKIRTAGVTGPVAMSTAKPAPKYAEPMQQRPVPAARTALGNGTGASLPKGERACLIAAAQHAEGVTRTQMTVLTGYKRSTRDAYIFRLREKGYVEAGERIIATELGIAALGADYEPLPTGRALQDHWLSSLPEGERRILGLLIGAYPETVERRVLDDATGFKRSTRDAYLARLRNRELIELEGAAVRATEKLFDG